MTFSEAIKSGFHKCLTLTGRASRSEYWYWVLFIILITFVLSFFGMTSDDSFIGFLTGIFFFLAHLTVAVRRLHDLNKSGWWVLLGMIPIIGTLFLFAWFTIQGTIGANQYGEDPLTA